MSVNLNASDLEAIIAQRISDAGGWIPFDQFMAAALYEPGLGYYESQPVFGRDGDFVTGNQMGRWLSLGYSDLIEWGWRSLDCPTDWSLVEQGGGTGALLVDVVEELRQRDVVPSRIIAIETSCHMRKRQQHLYAEHGLKVDSLTSLDEAGKQKHCLFFCNELPDAFPARSFRWKQGVMVERGVAHSGGRFVWQDGLPIDEVVIDESLKAQWPEGYVSEWNPNLVIWQEKVAAMMERGFLFCVDYGYTQQEYYRSQRIEGTLMGHRAHQVVEDVLESPGSCDITTHIDFSSLTRAGKRVGLMPVCFMSQGCWLAQSPSVQTTIRTLAADGGVESMQQLAHAKRLLLPFGMGETFKLLVQHINVGKVAPDYLEQFDRLGDLR